MTRYRLALAVMLALAAPAAVLAQLDTAWLRQYDCGGEDEDFLSDMAVDQLGNVHVCGLGYTGGVSTDIIVQKYGPTGTLEWTRFHAGGQELDDTASALVVDGSGNVYVCGAIAHVPGQGLDMFIAKYSPAGDSLWARTFARGGSGDDVALGICLTSSGRVAVTGFSAAADDPWNYDYCTMMLDAATGDTHWVRTYNRAPEDDEDVAMAICADGAGAVYVTGYSYDDGTDYDILTTKYTENGDRPWMRRYSRQFDDDYGMAIAWNPVTNSVSVGGVVYTDNQDYNYYTVAYGANGDSLWAREYNRYPADDEDLLTAVAVTTTGNTIVTGMSWDEATFSDCATVAYGPTGLPLWVSRYDGGGWDDAGLGLAVDSLGQVLVAGYAEDVQTDFDALLLKLGTDGSVVWAWRFDQSEGEDWFARVLPRPDGTMYAAGTVEASATITDFLVCRLRELLVDFSALALVAPDSIYLGDSVASMLVVRNEAIYPAEGWARFRATWTDHDDSAFVQLAPLEVDTVAFGVWYPDTTGTYELAGWVTVPGDERPGNDSAFVTLRVWGDTIGIGAPGAVALSAGFRLFPNPARGAVQVRAALAGEEPATVRLYDVTGSVVRTGTMARSASGEAATRLDLARLPAGVYFCRIEHERQEAVRKLIIQH
ncbi:MAG: T9SS type A sorting domain-containing protein [bacterium]